MYFHLLRCEVFPASLGTNQFGRKKELLLVSLLASLLTWFLIPVPEVRMEELKKVFLQIEGQ